MAGSPAEAVSRAIERSRQLLFPFKAEKWFALGFTVFLAQCGEGSSGSFQTPNLPGLPSGTSGSSAAPDLRAMIDRVLRALRDDLALYLILGAGAFLLGAALWLFIAWFSSRAKLMFVESVVWDRVDIPAQWERAGPLGLSLFKCRVALTLTGSLLGLLVFGAAVVVGVPDFLSGNLLGTRAVLAYAVGLLGVLFLAIPLAIALAVLDDFVVPLMVVRNAPVGQAWAMCRAEVLSGNVGGVALFYLVRLGLGVAIAIVVMALTCVTCCLTAIPYLGTVLLLPISVFSRAYPLYYLEQLGVTVFPLPEPTWAAYDQWRFPR